MILINQKMRKILNKFRYLAGI